MTDLAQKLIVPSHQHKSLRDKVVPCYIVTIDIDRHTDRLTQTDTDMTDYIVVAYHRWATIMNNLYFL